MTASSRPVRWGILATGKIAHSFARDLRLVPGTELVAVGSRREESARRFAAEYDVPHAHGSYADLVADPDVEVVYVASPHALHLEHARLAFEAGKHVVCEKPLTLSRAEGEEMVRLAHEHDRFLMEAMWTATHPVVRRLVAEVHAGRFGTPHQLHAELGFRVDVPPQDRMLNPDLGGGALLDMGVYPLTFAHLLLGEATELRGVATLSPAGIDLDVAITGRYPGGALATMGASMTSWSSRTASLATDLGRLVVEDFHHPATARFVPYDEDGPGEPVVLSGAEPVIGRGYGNEAAEAARCIREGLRESPLVPHHQTLTLLGQLDDLRAQIGVSYPGA
ncbi:Gfo/Idh/MocA family protein [Nocardioides sp. zg-DK7169]|uniref:Gfo/Idh/MocA family protein n=1 Tax=Nocardioides sp. zg-DK7169 TaxID=2736600 RepID=UPI0015541A75|nr:Gfo/Idh/MocA family oxidoreductase [Nocardioides sp. zg-DK7169]NPC98876.1 Gfo/Idh/MocA family oxidoreductase [Nocardioides sp. zg-DK7169]